MYIYIVHKKFNSCLRGNTVCFLATNEKFNILWGSNCWLFEDSQEDVNTTYGLMHSS